jgi:hypothetical protein
LALRIIATGHSALAIATVLALGLITAAPGVTLIWRRDPKNE